jgi:uncharacterized membrane protein YtjA (UPF0391 family)
LAALASAHRSDRQSFPVLAISPAISPVKIQLIYLRRNVMLQWALAFLVLALIAAVLGFGGMAASFAWFGKVLFVVFIVLFLVSLLTGAIRRPIA